MLPGVSVTTGRPASSGKTGELLAGDALAMKYDATRTTTMMYATMVSLFIVFSLIWWHVRFCASGHNVREFDASFFGSFSVALASSDSGDKELF